MILYHGTNVKFNAIDLIKCKTFKDFGKGFCCFETLKQAETMAKQMSERFGGTPTVLKFELNELIYLDKDIKILKFEEINLKWITFVLNNRDKKCKVNNYDIIIGPVADDDILVSIELYKNGYKDLNTLQKEFENIQTETQYSFQTQKSLQYLKGVN